MNSSHALIPLSGEAVALDAPTEELASFYSRLADLKREVRIAEDTVKQELASRLDKDNRRKDLYGDFEVEVDAPSQTEWDDQELARVLKVLVDEGRLTREAARAALEPVPVLKPRKRELQKLLTNPSLTPYDKELLAGCEHPLNRPRRVTVKRKGG